MRKLRFGCALLGVAVISSAVTAAFVSAATSSPARGVAHAAPVAHPHTTRRAALRRHVERAAAKALVSLHVRAKRRPHVTKRHVAALPGARRIGATPSLYERTTSISALRAQGCRSGKARTNGLVVLDFGMLAYRSRRGGYGTITFADRFASNRSITWALKSYARGYSACLPHRSCAKITLARGTSNYGRSVPSTYTAGRLWAGATVALANYLKRHHFDHVTAAAGDDVEPAWDRGFRWTYDFFRGYARFDHGYLLYNYGSLDGGSATSGSCARRTTSRAEWTRRARCPRSTTARWRVSGRSSPA